MEAPGSWIETERRMAIVAALPEHLDPTCCLGILLTGSLVYGRNTLVHQHSDIDLLCIVEQERACTLKAMKFFRGPYLNDAAFALFEAGRVDALFNDYVIDGVKLNIGIWRSAFLQDFCRLQATRVRFYKDALRRTNQTVYTCEQEAIILVPAIERIAEGYILNYPLYRHGKLLSLPLLTNLLFCEVLHDNGECRELAASFIAALKREYTTTELEHLAAYVLKRFPSDRSAS